MVQYGYVIVAASNLVVYPRLAGYCPECLDAAHSGSSSILCADTHTDALGALASDNHLSWSQY